MKIVLHECVFCQYKEKLIWNCTSNVISKLYKQPGFVEENIASIWIK